MRILIAVDTVETTEMLMNAVAGRTWPRGAVARVVSVVEDETVSQDVRQEMRRRGEQVSALAVEPLRWLGVEAEVAVLRGDPQRLIPFEARRWGAELIVIRARDRTGFRSRMLGSVAKSVTRHAPCSVEVVRAPRAIRRAARGEGMRVLLATDGSAHSAGAVRAVAAQAWPEGAGVKVTSMVNPVAYSLEELGLLQGGWTARARRAIDDAARVLTRAGLHVTAEVVAGRPAKRILGAAREMDADLIVVGTEDRGGLKRLLCGSVSENVAAGAHCSVSIVRANDEDARDDGRPVVAGQGAGRELLI